MGCESVLLDLITAQLLLTGTQGMKLLGGSSIERSSPAWLPQRLLSIRYVPLVQWILFRFWSSESSFG